ncbi:hypothetical protein AQUCO_01300791v1 [Aquilegia coerulea]|uniref:K Homology domain-containing protein n=2 Tax=Aquilegia coerulea TaxID=218851 RepID=A0A2G5E416_AQUCA|nr:hypothetical protein AQUCO_01300791v1 [Aquilegia coerulea]
MSTDNVIPLSVAEEGNENGNGVVIAVEPERNAKRSYSGAFNQEGEQNNTNDSQSPKRRVIPHEVLFRLVVPSMHIGRVIGTKGSRIQKIREETRATIKIADAVNRVEDRVIIINSSGNEGEISDAERALLHIARVILTEDDVGFFMSNIGIQHVTQNMIQLLIAGSQAGCLIGKAGQNIVKLRNSSGAGICILPKNQLILCASAHESDRLLQISGGIPEILKALEEISCQIRENSPSKVISIRPAQNLSLNSLNPFLAQTSADFITSEMTVPETLVGGLIGKGGSNISRIRNESGATIKVSGGRGEQNLRHVYFGGSSQQVALARKFIDEYIYFSQSSQWQGS